MTHHLEDGTPVRFLTDRVAIVGAPATDIPPEHTVAGRFQAHPRLREAYVRCTKGRIIIHEPTRELLEAQQRGRDELPARQARGLAGFYKCMCLIWTREDIGLRGLLPMGMRCDLCGCDGYNNFATTSSIFPTELDPAASMSLKTTRDRKGAIRNVADIPFDEMRTLRQAHNERNALGEYGEDDDDSDDDGSSA